ncbi:MAG: DUF420 domain-containing protein [Bdellovibrionota bacterium]
MFGPSFLGTRADALMDLVILSLIIVVPALFVSYSEVKRKRFKKHRNIQVGLASVLTVAVGLFEYDLKSLGGIFKITEGSSYAGTWILNCSIYTHMVFSLSTAPLWIGLILASLLKFPNPPKPGSFSNAHRIWGRIAMVDMLLTGITAVNLYVIGFVL